MTSIGPYHQKTNMTFMFDKHDLRGSLPQKTECINSISNIISMNPDFSKFRYILRLSKLDNLYNDKQANFTLFVPSDACLSNIPDAVFVNMDLLTARSIIKASTLNRKITSDILSDSPCAYFMSNSSINRLFVSNNNGQILINNNINVIGKDIMAENGIIHVIDNLIWPLII
jgi:transforming growth factor-beta-induced protein